jgi:phosphatidylserine decarboxylase
MPQEIIDRKTKKIESESIYFEKVIAFLYGESLFSRLLGRFFLHTIAKWPLFSSLFGYLQRLPSSKKKIEPFIQKYRICTSEFQKSVQSFSSFDDFFTRELKKETRPLAACSAIIPADGRYLFFQEASLDSSHAIKGYQLPLKSLTCKTVPEELFEGGTLVLARLAPLDCHRFYFPCDCVPQAPILIKGKLFSVHPLARGRSMKVFCKNKRMVTLLEKTPFGKVAFIEIGATNVGSIVQTFQPGKAYKKGDEKGYFSFGGSAIIMLFEKGAISLEKDLIEPLPLEMRCLIGEPLGERKL